jgi:general secretion pathway protein M
MQWRRILKLEKNDILRRLAEFSPRERFMAVGGVLVVLFYGLYLVVYAPIAAEKALLEQKINAQQLAYQQIQKISLEVAALRQNKPASEIVTDDQSVMTVIDASSNQMEVKPGIKRMIPEGADKVTLWLENIAFDKLINWLAILETKHAITVEQISINRQQANKAVVNAKILLIK